MIDAELSKAQVLELYLNRIYLSAGVYGVETMSRAPLRQAGEAPDAGRDARSSPGWRARRRRSRRGPTSTARSRAATSSWRGCARRGSSPPSRSRRRGAARIRVRPYPAARRSRRPAMRKEFLRQQFRDQFGGDHPPDWTVRTTFVPELQDAAERAVARRAGALRRAEACRRRWSRSTRGPATSSRWSAAATSASRQFNRADPQPPAAGLGVQAVPVRRGARARLLAGLGAQRTGHVGLRGRTNGPRATRAARRPRRSRCARRSSSRTTAPRRRCSSGWVARRSCAWPATSACRPARRAVAVARHRARSRRWT